MEELVWFLGEHEGEWVVFCVLCRLVLFPLCDGEFRFVLRFSFSFSFYKFLIFSFRSKWLVSILFTICLQKFILLFNSLSIQFWFFNGICFLFLLFLYFSLFSPFMGWWENRYQCHCYFLFLQFLLLFIFCIILIDKVSSYSMCQLTEVDEVITL